MSEGCGKPRVSAEDPDFWLKLKALLAQTIVPRVPRAFVALGVGENMGIL